MKKKYLFFISLLILFVVGLIFYNHFKVDNVYKEENLNNSNNINKGISMNLEQTAGAGDYKLVTQSEWPTDGYIFNSELSKCENGSTLSWDDTKKSVIMQGNVSDKCYVYFDIYHPLLTEYVMSQYTGTQGDNGIYYHNSTLTNGAGDNSYRYAGANPNNYVCFGSSESICPDANLFRIIGVFENQVKVIRVKSESSQMWNKSVSNTWSTSGLNTYLNGTYLTSLGNLSDKIAIATWKVGGNIHENIVKVTPSVAFQNEIIGTAESATFNAKIGLMYVTDYYYAASPSAWTLVGYNESDATKDYRAATSVNWLYLRNHEWTITRVSDNSQTVFLVGAEGNTFSYLAFDLECEVRPTFSLEPSVTYVSGSGTMDNPIRIS